MTNEERDLITRFIERVGGAVAPVGLPGQQGAVAPLPPIDREADALIADLFNRHPEARYRVTQMAVVQEHALVEAQNRINRLQWELQQARQSQPDPQRGASPWGAAAGAGMAAAPPQQSRGFFSNLFGGGQQQQPQQQQYSAAPPPPQYPPNYNPGMFQQQGPGFFGSALRTAAGVAGGMVAANALMGLFSGGHGSALAGGLGGSEAAGGLGGALGSPWGGGSGADPYDAGGAPKDDAGSDKFGGPATVDQSAWTPAPDQSGGGGWTDAGLQDTGSQDTGWQDAGSQDSGWQDDSSGSDWGSGDDTV